jgi:N-acetylmuramoyl-L-alanine amidase
MDLERTFVSSSIDKYIPIKDGLLQTARAGQYNKSTVRVVLDINNMDDYKIFHLYDPFRIVVDVKGGGRTPVVAAAVKSSPSSRSTSTRPVNKGMKKTKSPDGSISLARQLGLNVERIVIDPGHGGKDPGCSFKGVYEKDIVLKLAKVVKSQLEKNIGCEVFLTRNTDIFLPLDERTAFANVKRADLFVSLHVNAHKQSSVNGIETYYLNMATDEEAVMVAARENATSQKNISDLQGILNDLMLNTKITESSKLAYDIQNSIIAGVKKSHKTIKNLGVKQAPFYVLIGAEMPAILIETGFITNYTERQRLQSDVYYGVIARSIVSATDTYIKSIGIGG